MTIFWQKDKKKKNDKKYQQEVSTCHLLLKSTTGKKKRKKKTKWQYFDNMTIFSQYDNILTKRQKKKTKSTSRRWVLAVCYGGRSKNTSGSLVFWQTHMVEFFVSVSGRGLIWFIYYGNASKICEIWCFYGTIENEILNLSSSRATIAYYSSPTSGEAYRDRLLTTNFELWVEIFCVRTCFHMRIPKPCLSVCLSVRPSVRPYPREKKSP